MSAEKHPDWLIDRLYSDDLLDDDSSLESREDLTQEQQAQLLEMQQFLGELREHMLHMPLAEPQASLRANILEAAQQEITAQSEQVASATRKPQTPRGSSDSLWSRNRFHAIAQISVVAAVLIVGVFSLAQFQKGMAPANESAGLPEMASAKTTKTAAPAALAKADTAKKDTPQSNADFPDTKPATTKATNPTKDAALALNKAEAKDPSQESIERGVKVARKKATKTVQRKPEPKAIAYKPKKKKRSINDDGFGFDGSKYNNTSTKSNASKDFLYEANKMGKKKNDSIFSSPEAPSSSSRGVSSKNSAGINDLLKEKAKQPTTKRQARTAPAKAAPVKGTATSDSVSDKQTIDTKSKKVKTPTLTSIERNYRAERFDNTLTEANNYLKTGKGTAKQRARALELKAKSYEKLGQSDQANRIYAEIRKKYPTYYKKKAIKYPAKRSKKKSKSKIDLMDY